MLKHNLRSDGLFTASPLERRKQRKEAAIRLLLLTVTMLLHNTLAAARLQQRSVS